MFSLTRPPYFLPVIVMYILYLDDSGSVKNATDSHVILAGIAVFERKPHWLSNYLDELAEDLWPESPSSLEFRGSSIFSGRSHWRGIQKDRRFQAYEDALRFLGTSRQVHLFGAAIHKRDVSPDDPIEYGFEQIVNRFDRFLGRLHRANNTQRGLVVLDETSYETTIQSLAREFRQEGHRWGQLYNLADVPLFVDSKATRMVQWADLIAYAVRKYYENGDSRYFDLIAHRFDGEGGVNHGLVHYRPEGVQCNCFACR